jgi:hypothetical protein
MAATKTFALSYRASSSPLCHKASRLIPGQATPLVQALGHGPFLPVWRRHRIESCSMQRATPLCPIQSPHACNPQPCNHTRLTVSLKTPIDVVRRPPWYKVVNHRPSSSICFLHSSSSLLYLKQTPYSNTAFDFSCNNLH